jgi:hypothetical protein
MTRRTLRRALTSLAVTSALPLLLLGCPKKTTPSADAGAPPPTASSSGPTVLTPLDDDAGDQDAAEAAPPPHATGHPVNINTAHIKQCCTALRTQAKALGASPEANVLLSFAVQCENVAAQAGGGNAPEFAAFRQLLKGRVLPAGCQGL